MAKINWQDIGELTAIDATSIGKAIIIPAKEALRQVRFALGGNLTIRDNAYAAIITLGYQGNSTQTLTTGTEYTFQNPLKTEPIGFTPIMGIDANGSAIATPICSLNLGRTDGLMGITPSFSDSTIGSQVRTFTNLSSSVAITNNTTANIASITVPAGVHDLSTITYLNGSGGSGLTGTAFVTGISLTSAVMTPTSTAGDSRADIPTMPTATSAVTLSIPQFRISVLSSTAYFLVINSLFTVGNATAWGRISSVKVAPPTNYSGIVTGILWGG